MGNVTKFPKERRSRVRPLTKRYQPTAPYEVERCDEENGSITYDVTDMRPDSYRFVCGINDRYVDNAKWHAEQIARGLNMLVQYGLEKLPKMRDRE